MTDSPAIRIPIDPQEQPILDRLLATRTALEFLKQDKSTYVKSQDVYELYGKVVEQVGKLNEIRTSKRTEQNRVDTVLDDCFQLISLFFLTVGKNNEAPAVYSAVSTMKRVLDHLREAAFFSPKDLDSVRGRLQDYRLSCDKGQDEYCPHMLTLINARIDVCKETLADLDMFLSRLSPELSPRYEKLVSILRSLSALNTRSKFPEAEVDELVQQVKEIDRTLDWKREFKDDMSLEEYYDGLAKFKQDAAPQEENLVAELLTRCLLWARVMKEKQGKIDERFRDKYDQLLAIRNKLESLSLTQAWSLRETDLYAYQRKLDRFDESRVDGNFLDAEGKPADLHAQRTLLYLLRKSYATIYFLIISSEPVSEALLPIYNQLMTLRRCLLEVKNSGGVSSPRELYPYSMKLNSIDNMRHDGKFMVGRDIPDGQGAVTQLLSECFDIAYELRTEAEENDSDDD